MTEDKISTSHFNVKQYLKAIIEHGNHHVVVRIGKYTLHPCARCFGMYTAMALMLPVILAYHYNFFSLGFGIAFALSWILVSPSIIDWTTTKFTRRKGSNTLRVITGGLLGAGIMTYVFLLPASWIFRIVTFVIYELSFSMVTLIVHCSEYGIKPLSLISRHATTKNTLAYGCAPEVSCCCDCCFPNCNFSYCFIIPLLFCCCSIPLCCASRGKNSGDALSTGAKAGKKGAGILSKIIKGK